MKYYVIMSSKGINSKIRLNRKCCGDLRANDRLEIAWVVRLDRNRENNDNISRRSKAACGNTQRKHWASRAVRKFIRTCHGTDFFRRSRGEGMSGKKGCSGRRPMPSAYKKQPLPVSLRQDLIDEIENRAAQTASGSRSAIVEAALRRDFNMPEVV